MLNRHRSKPMFKTSLRKFTTLSVLTGSVLLIGITGRAQDSAKKQTAASKPVSGFLGDYSSLTPDPKNGDLLLYEKDRSAMKKYDKFIINPITIYLLPAKHETVVSILTIWNDWLSTFMMQWPTNSRNPAAIKS